MVQKPEPAKTAPETNRQGPVDLFSGSFLRGSITPAVDDTQDFANTSG
jgi:hypothetical protein